MSLPSRREFIRTTAATAAAGSLASGVKAQPSDDVKPDRRDIQYSLKIGMIQEGDTLLEKFRIHL